MRLIQFKILSFFLLLLPFILYSRQIETFYGPMEVEEPVLLELIDASSFQRLKNIHQYGVSYYTTHKEEYNRYDHSIGVFAILRASNRSLKEQIAGLLHDVSHTAFSHVGDYIFGKENEEKDYQNDIHPIFLKESGLEKILHKYNYTVDEILPVENLFPALENKLPHLCADRIDYNIQGAYYQKFITYDEALLLFKDLTFINNDWVSRCPELVKKLGRFSLFMTKNCWGSPTNYMTSRWLADAILRAIDLGCISYKELHFGTDQIIWDKLMAQDDEVIQKNMAMIMNARNYFSLSAIKEEADCIVKSKFRGIDPWIMSGSQQLRLTEIDAEFKKEYEKEKELIHNGWFIKIISEPSA